MVSAEPVVSSPPVQAPASTGWEKKSEKPLLDIHKRLDHMMDSKGKSLEDRYQDRFGDQLPESVATDSARKDYTEKKTNKPNIVFKPRSKLKLTPKKKTTPKDEEKPVPKKETKDNKVSRLSNKIGSGLKSSGSKTKSALGSAGSAVGRGAGAITSGIGRGAGAVKSGIGRGASSVMGLFGRGSSKEEKPKKGRKTTTDNADYSSMKLPELRAALKKKGLPTSGNKTALIKRLKK
jgi:outer membrane biosynthesis protein TonB